jgi:hypothetical protein
MQKTQSSNLKEYTRTQEKRYTEEYEEEYTTTQTSPQSDFFIFALIGFVLESVAISLEVILRKNFGSRYFTPLKFVFGLVIVSTLTGASFLNFGDFLVFTLGQRINQNKIYEFTGETSQPQGIVNFSLYVFISYLAMYLFFGLGELKKAFEREREGKDWHTYFTGESRFSVLENATEYIGMKSYVGKHLVANHIVQLYVEPLFLFSLGISIFIFLPMVGSWLVTGSVAVFIRGQLVYNRIRRQVLDMKDSRIESKYMVKAMEGAEPSRTAGLTALAIRPNITQITLPATNAMQEAFKKNPELAKMAGATKIDPDKDTSKTIEKWKQAIKQ